MNMDRLKDLFRDADAKLYVFAVRAVDKIRSKKYFSKFVWWLMFRRYKDCKKFCPSCDYLDRCQFDTRLAYKNAKQHR